MSDQDTSIFGTSNPEPEHQSSMEDLLKGITNESGEQKYADVPTALKALATSQQYIPELHQKLSTKDAEILQLREELTRRSAVEDVIERLKPTPQDPQPDPVQHGLDAAEAAKLFEQLLNKSEQQKARETNVSSVLNAMLEKYGDKAEQVFYSKGREVGLNQEQLNDLAGTSPAAVLALFGTKPEVTASDVSTKSSIYIDPTPKEETLLLERNQGKSVLSGSTSQDVREEAAHVRRIVEALHKEGGTAEELTDPKMYRKYFGRREA